MPRKAPAITGHCCWYLFAVVQKELDVKGAWLLTRDVKRCHIIRHENRWRGFGSQLFQLELDARRGNAEQPQKNRWSLVCELLGDPVEGFVDAGIQVL